MLNEVAGVDSGGSNLSEIEMGTTTTTTRGAGKKCRSVSPLPSLSPSLSPSMGQHSGVGSGNGSPTVHNNSIPGRCATHSYVSFTQC